MNNNLKHAGLSWEEAIRLDAVTEEHVLHMQNIIINQEGIIEDLEIRVTDTERLLGSLDVTMMLDNLNKLDFHISGEQGNNKIIELIQEIRQELINFERRK
jgi:hypothetical protein